jgi:hypothetical protein
MNYTNQYNVRFKIAQRGTSQSWLVKYYSPNSKWPRHLKVYVLPDEETRREMFYILNSSRLCTICKDHVIDDSRSTCNTCIMNEAAVNGTAADVAECPVCYDKMFRVDRSKCRLACGHEMCRTCINRMRRPVQSSYIEPSTGRLIPTCTITCPLCRGQGWYDYGYRILRTTAPIN